MCRSIDQYLTRGSLTLCPPEQRRILLPEGRKFHLVGTGLLHRGLVAMCLLSSRAYALSALYSATPPTLGPKQKHWGYGHLSPPGHNNPFSRRAVTDLLHCMHVYFCLGFTCALFSQYNLRIFFLYLTRITIQIFSRDFQRGVSATIRSNLFVISWKNSLDSIGANSREKNVSK